MPRTPLPAMYGPRKAFASAKDAETFSRHLTRELTAGGIPHWVEVRAAAKRWTVFVHRFECAGGADCRCEQED